MELEPTKDLSAFNEILAQEGFIRSLAKKLVHDDELANDVFQETLLAALRKPRKSSSPLRSWLARVVHNRVAQSHRHRLRRERHEAMAEASRPALSPSELAERDGVRAHVVSAVQQMDEPYRSAILLRFYEDLEPREMAARLGVPVETARTRVKRGLALLRARLDREYGSTEIWGFALAAWAPPDHGAPLIASGASGSAGVHAGRWGAGVLALIGCVVLWWFLRDQASRAPGGGEAQVATNAGDSTNLAPTSAANAEDRAASAATPARDELTVRVVADDDRAPLANAALDFARLDGVRAKLLTDSEGLARFIWPRDRALELEVLETDSTLATHARLAPDERPKDDRAWTVQVERASSIAGRTIDRFGEAVAGARVRVWERDETVDKLLAQATTDSGGAFVVGRLPHRFRATIESDERVASEQLIAELAHAARLESLEFVLDDPAPTSGRVVDRDGNGLAEVHIALDRVRGDADVRAGAYPDTWFVGTAGFETTTGSGGAFDVASLPHGRYRLIARKDGFASISHNVIAGTRTLELTLEPGFALELEVLDASSNTIPGARLTARLASDADRGGRKLTESHETDERGRARIEGCLEGTLAWVRATAPGAATNLYGPFEIRADSPRERILMDAGRELAGSVVDAFGRPLAGATISARAVVSKQLIDSMSLPWSNELCELGRTQTALDGSFGFAALARCEMELEVRESELGPAFHVETITATASRADIRLAVPKSSFALDGRVFDGWSGEALREFTVTALPDDVAERTCRVSAHVDDGSGRFALRVGEVGDWVLSVTSPGYAELALALPKFHGTEGALELAMYSSRGLDVRVVDRRGTPVPFATIAVADRDERPLPIPLRKREARSAVQVGARGEATLRELPASLVRLHVTTPLAREPRDFEFQLKSPIEGVQELALPDVDVDEPQRTIDLELLTARDGAEVSLVLDGERPADARPFTGHIAVRAFDLAGRRVLSFVGTNEDGRMRLDANRHVLYVLHGEREGTHYAWFQELRPNWGAAWGREFFATGDALAALPLPLGECRLELTLDGREPLSITVPDARAEARRPFTVTAFLTADAH